MVLRRPTGVAAIVLSLLMISSLRDARAQALPALDFSKPAHYKAARAGRSKTKRATEGENALLVWRVAERRGSAFLDVHHTPKDLRSSEALSFRYKSDTPIPGGTIRVRIYDTKRGYIGISLPTATPVWRDVRIPLGYFEEGAPFDPTDIRFLEFVTWDPKRFDLCLDDLTWVPGTQGERSWRGRRAPAADLTKPDAESATTAANARTGWSAATGITWHVQAGQEWADLTLRSLPHDVRSFVRHDRT